MQERHALVRARRGEGVVDLGLALALKPLAVPYPLCFHFFGREDMPRIRTGEVWALFASRPTKAVHGSLIHQIMLAHLQH